MTLLDEIGDFGRGRTAIVGGENHQRVLGHPLFVELGEHFAHHPIGLHHKITVTSDRTLTLPLARRNDGGVWAGQGQVEKEGLALVLLHVTGNELARLAGEILEAFGRFKVFTCRSGAHPLLGHCRDFGRHVILEIDVGKHVE